MSDQTQEIEEVVEPVQADVEASTDTDVAGEATVAAEVIEAYQPDYTYKVYGEQKELPEFLRPLVKDKEVESYFRTYHQKAEAFDVLKEKHEKAQSEYANQQESFQKELAPVFESIQQMKRAADISDYDSFFKAAGVKSEDVFKWAVEKARYQDLTPEQRQMHDHRIATLRENSQLRYENEQTTAQMQDVLVSQRERELSLTLEDPTVNQIMQEFDSKRGRAGAFREEIVAYANGQWYAKRQDITPRQAVEGVLGLMGRNLDQGVMPHSTTQTNSANPAVVPPRTTKPTLPTMRSGHASPVKRAARSLDELRKIADQIQE